MTSLTDVYSHRMGAVASRTRVLAGVALFALGTGMTAAGVVLATTGVGAIFDLGTYGARELAGVLAGIGLPATLLGVLAVLPTSPRTRASAILGASLCVFAVALYTQVYPLHWPGAPAAEPLLALATLSVYFLGAITTAWCLFMAVATFRTRKSPGGTAEMYITEEGRIKLVRDADVGTSTLGGVGMFGNDPDGDVPTQTGPAGPESGTDDAPRTASDGGSTTAEPAQADAAFLSAASTRGQPDRYCGNCEHFHYIRLDGEIEPYCDDHERYMDDIDPCEEWSSNSPDRSV